MEKTINGSTETITGAIEALKPVDNVTAMLEAQPDTGYVTGNLVDGLIKTAKYFKSQGETTDMSPFIAPFCTEGKHDLCDVYVVKPNGKLIVADYCIKQSDDPRRGFKIWHNIGRDDLILSWKIPYPGCGAASFASVKQLEIDGGAEYTPEQITTSKELWQAIADQYGYNYEMSLEGFDLLDTGWELKIPRYTLAEGQAKAKLLNKRLSGLLGKVLATEIDFREDEFGLYEILNDKGEPIACRYHGKEYLYEGSNLYYLEKSIVRFEVMYQYEIAEAAKIGEFLEQYLNCRPAIEARGGQLISLGEKGVYVYYPEDFERSRLYGLNSEDYKDFLAAEHDAHDGQGAQE